MLEFASLLDPIVVAALVKPSRSAKNASEVVLDTFRNLRRGFAAVVEALKAGEDVNLTTVRAHETKPTASLSVALRVFCEC